MSARDKPTVPTWAWGALLSLVTLLAGALLTMQRAQYAELREDFKALSGEVYMLKSDLATLNGRLDGARILRSED